MIISGKPDEGSLGPIVEARAWVEHESIPDPDNPGRFRITPKGKGEIQYELVTINSKGERVVLSVDRGLYLMSVNTIRKWGKGR